MRMIRAYGTVDTNHTAVKQGGVLGWSWTGLTLGFPPKNANGGGGGGVAGRNGDRTKRRFFSIASRGRYVSVGALRECECTICIPVMHMCIIR